MRVSSSRDRPIFSMTPGRSLSSTTSAVAMIPGASGEIDRMSKPEIMADAAYAILTRDARTTTGRFFIDDELLARHGVTDLDPYSVVPGTRDFIPDFFVD